jgi:hypothetical protein
VSLDLLTAMLDGGRVTLCVIVALCFARLSRATRDRLYAAFAVAFVLLGVNWTLLGMQTAGGDHSALAFLPRLLAFLLIIAAIVDKNRRAARRR